MTINHYRLHCNDEDADFLSWAEEAPTECPNNSGHSVQAAVVVATQTLTQIQQLNDEGTVVNIPMTTNKTPIFNPDLIPPGYLLYVTGAFDDITNEKIGEGDQIEKSVAYDGGPQLDYCEGQFLHHQYVIGGEFGCHSEAIGDWASMLVWAPASAPTFMTAGNGNASLLGTLNIDNKSGTFEANEVIAGGTSTHQAVVVAVLSDTALLVAHIKNTSSTNFQNDEQITGGTSGATADVNGAIAINMIVPATNGYWNVDGSTLQAGEINQSMVPVPNQSTPQDGWWNWDPTESPSLTPAPSQNGAYDLYDVAIPLVRQANRVSMLLHEKECCPEAVRGKKLLPHWKLRFYVYRKTSGQVDVAFSMKFGRKLTVNADDLV